jgi:hypothetical protein
MNERKREEEEEVEEERRKTHTRMRESNGVRERACSTYQVQSIKFCCDSFFNTPVFFAHAPSMAPVVPYVQQLPHVP